MNFYPRKNFFWMSVFTIPCTIDRQLWNSEGLSVPWKFQSSTSLTYCFCFMHDFLCFCMTYSADAMNYFWQSGMHLLVDEHPLMCRAHHMLWHSSLLLLSHLEWNPWMFLHIHVVIFHWVVLVVIVLNLLFVQILILLHITRGLLVQWELDLSRWGIMQKITFEFSLFHWFTCLVWMQSNLLMITIWHSSILSRKVFLCFANSVSLFTVLFLQAKCVDFILTILYVILVSIFLGWGLFHRKRERDQSSRMNPVSNIKDSGEVTGKKDENLPMQVPPVSYLFLSSGFVVLSFWP